MTDVHGEDGQGFWTWSVRRCGRWPLYEVSVILDGYGGIPLVEGPDGYPNHAVGTRRRAERKGWRLANRKAKRDGLRVVIGRDGR